MYLNILKKDMKRKKTMNIILLLFTLLASVFVASGVSNVITVMNGTEYFMDKSGMKDYLVLSLSGGTEAEELLSKSENVSEYTEEPCYFISKSDLLFEGKEINTKNNINMIQSVDRNGINYFHTDDSILTEVKEGQVYVPVSFFENNKEIKAGDSITFKMGDEEYTYEIAGAFKDAIMGSDLMGNSRFLLNDQDYKKFEDNSKLENYKGGLYYVDVDDDKAFASELSEINDLAFNRSTIMTCYVMEMVVAMIVLVVSICLILVSFVILKFVINFSIVEEFREIGVMKAIGISNRKIRSLYIFKYMVISLVGGIIGLILSFPFGDFLISEVSKKMVLGNDMGPYLNVLGAVIVAVVMVAFAYLCTRRINKATPVDAIRNGQTGERYKKKTIYRLSKAHTSNPLYMAINDIVSAPRRFIIITISFFLCSIIVFGVVMVADTMKSDSLIGTFGKKSDIYITDSKLMKLEFMSQGGDELMEEAYDELEDTLEKNQMPGAVSMEVWFKYPIEVNGKKYSTMFQQNKRTLPEDYEYEEGQGPQKADEIAITPVIAKEYEIGIGDTVIIDFGTEKKECIVVGIFQSMNQLGSLIRFHSDAPTDMVYSSALMALQIDFEDHPSAGLIDERIEQLKDIYNIEDVMDSGEYCADCIGVVDTMDLVSKLLLIVVGVVVALVTVLMEKSFIYDEKGQIALLKAIGFGNVSVIKWHIYRFMIVGLISELIAIALTNTVTKLWCDPIWKMMGATNVQYVFNPLTLILFYPGIVMLVTLVFATLTALGIRKISSRDMACIE